MTRLEKLLKYFTLILALSSFLFSISVHAAETVDGLNAKSMLDALKNLNKESDAFKRLLMAFSYILGILMILSALLKLKKFGHLNAFQASSAQLIGPLVRIGIGILMFYLPTFIQISTKSVIGSSTQSILEYRSGTGEQGVFETTLRSVGGIIQVVGIFSFIRGWIIVARSTQEGNQPGTLGKGITFVIGGLLAINIYATIDLVKKSLGLGGG